MDEPRVPATLSDSRACSRRRLAHVLAAGDIPVVPTDRGAVHLPPAFDWNCTQHIPLRFESDKLQAALDERDQRIGQLEWLLAAIAPERRGR